MKLYAFRPKGHGEKSFYIMAINLKIAKEKVEKYCNEMKMDKESYGYDYFIDNDYYYFETYEENEIAENNND